MARSQEMGMLFVEKSKDFKIKKLLSHLCLEFFNI